MVTSVARVAHRHVDVEGVRVFYRESLPDSQDAPVLLLLHGFPSGSHQFRRLIDVLGAHYRLVAPDYPGFGHTEAPEGFTYSFDRLADITESFVERLGLDRFVLYVFDYGAPVGFRLAQRHPEWIAGLITQNGNAYEEGLSDAAHSALTLNPKDPATDSVLRDLFTLEGTRSQYETGVRDTGLISPDGWTLDQHFLDGPGRKDAQRALFLDYHTNIESYGRWQSWLRKHTPPTLVVWGRDDPYFVEAGARAYLRDLPEAELHLLDTGHFALDTHLPEIAPLIADFLDRAWT
ncbi:alpha/beta fold hydrolase [Saccharomonospora xinjiangensis]|uniref:Putative hydrolase or acyltransferase of alpha/beta superfamily n=1 Tax=Saccharomonospora xinjiangensis XJ-54 TaxID=882086 RepID=I0V8J2_9PSEU|nr:alpha/beta hydrolase [Saccharomonospora xinjiangensis]EID56445.1 putative hydrolase or acyltransferase of alpha/beta superfamily [Saccharomonospora xinjiangensis XJ-54]